MKQYVLNQRLSLIPGVKNIIALYGHRSTIDPENGLLYIFTSRNRHISSKRLWVPKALEEMILHNNHGSTLTGHSGELGTYERIATKYFWPTMSQDISEFVRHCKKCHQLKDPKAEKNDRKPISGTDIVFSSICDRLGSRKWKPRTPLTPLKPFVLLYQNENPLFRPEAVFVSMLVPTWLHFGTILGWKWVKAQTKIASEPASKHNRFFEWFFDRFLDHFGLHFGVSFWVPGPPKSYLSPRMGHLGPILAILYPFLVHFDRFGTKFGSFGTHLGSIF